MSEFYEAHEQVRDTTPELLNNLDGVEAREYEGEKSLLEVFGDAVSAMVENIREFFGGTGEAKEFEESYAEKAAEALAEVFDEQTLSDWGGMSLEERAEKLNEFYEKAGEALGIDAKGVIIEDCGEGTLGYNGGDGYLHIDFRNVADPEQLEAVLNTTLHEMRHQLQFEAIENPERFPDLSPALIEAWERNMVNYNNGDFDLEGYFNQVVEVDSRVFAADALSAYLEKLGGK